jgi:serine/threonine protein kinase
LPAGSGAKLPESEDELEFKFTLPGEEATHRVGSVVAGRFRVLRLLGRGGMGEVYLTEDLRLGRQVALKVLSPSLSSDPQYVQRFEREARAASALNHPAVCVIHEIGQADDGCPFIAMELLEGESLDARMGRGGLTIAEIVDIGAQVAEALDAAHAKGIIHRDIKPANVAIGAGGRVKVLDFGLAKRLAGTDDGARLGTSSIASTQTGMLLGTPSYMSPEQALGAPCRPPLRPVFAGGNALRVHHGARAIRGIERRRDHRAPPQCAARRHGEVQLRSAAGARPHRPQVHREVPRPALPVCAGAGS